MKNRFVPRLTKTTTRRERLQLIVLGVASIFEGLVAVLSLGYLTVDTRAWLLFDFFDRDARRDCTHHNPHF